jgi:hypothetical protein
VVLLVRADERLETWRGHRVVTTSARHFTRPAVVKDARSMLTIDDFTRQGPSWPSLACACPHIMRRPRKK